MLESGVPTRYERAPSGSMLDPTVFGRNPVRRRLQQLRSPQERPVQRMGYRPAQVLQLDSAELPTRPKIAGRERRVYDNLRSVVARRERDVVQWNRCFLHLRGHYAFHTSACTPRTPREKGSVEGSVRHLKTGSARGIPSLRDLDEQYRDWPEQLLACLERGAVALTRGAELVERLEASIQSSCSLSVWMTSRPPRALGGDDAAVQAAPLRLTLAGGGRTALPRG